MTQIPNLTEEDWKEYLKKLTLHAQKKFFKLGWIRKQGYRVGPQGIGPQDVVSEAIKRVIEGKRKYNEHAYPDLLSFLYSVVDSIIWNMLSRTERKKVQPLQIGAHDCDQTENPELSSKVLTPIQILTNKDIVKKVETILMRNFVDDDIVLGILECLRAGINKPSEIAEYLEVETKHVNNAQKRLRRVIETNLQECGEEYLK